MLGVFGKLPNEIVYKICEWLDIIQVNRLYLVNKSTRKRILNIQDLLISNELMRFDKDNLLSVKKKFNLAESKYFFYHFLTYNFDLYCEKYKFVFRNYFGWKIDELKDITLKDLIIRYRSDVEIPYYYEESEGRIIKPIFDNVILNKLYEDIFSYYIQNDFKNLENYPNRLHLMILYYFIHIEMYPNIYTNDRMFDFLNRISYHEFYDVKLNYYTIMIEVMHNGDYTLMKNTYEKMYQMSNCIVSLEILKKLIGYKVLDLSNALLYTLQDESGYVDFLIKQICRTKMKFMRDDLVCHNYNQIKNLLRQLNRSYYDMMIERENYLINNMIYVKNPTSNRRMRVNGTIFKYLTNSNNQTQRRLCSLKDYIDIENYILKQQRTLRTKFFS
jgi:hypothetical protein